MYDAMNWDQVYMLWKRGAVCFPESLSSPLEFETVPVSYRGGGYFYGYDWLENGEGRRRKARIQKNAGFLLISSRPTHKGTIHTLEMLAEARDDEERVAIWIAATAHELKRACYNPALRDCAHRLYDAAEAFLQNRFFMWHHAMKRLVPEILLPRAVLSGMRKTDEETVMQLIQMNTLMVKGTHSVFNYTSLKHGETPESHSVRIS